MSKSLTFKSAERRHHAIAVVASIVPNGMIAFAVVYSLRMPDHIAMFFVILVALWIVEAVFWLRNILWSWATFSMRGKKRQSDALFIYMRDNGFPRPIGYYADAEDYFLQIADDDTKDVDLRMKALALAVRRRSYGEMGRFSIAIQQAISAEDAVQRLGQAP